MILNDHWPEPFVTITYSLPNLMEAIMGSLVVLIFLESWNRSGPNVKSIFIHLIGITLAGIYVITQELKWHNLGGNNVYDPNDLVASVIGLVGVFLMVRKFGILQDSLQSGGPE